MGAIPRKVFEEASARSRSDAFICSLLKVAAEFAPCRRRKRDGEDWFGVDDIRSCLLDRFPDSPVVWDSLANLELLGNEHPDEEGALGRCLRTYRLEQASLY